MLNNRTMGTTKENLFTLQPINFKEMKHDSNFDIKQVKTSEFEDKYDPLLFCRTCANMDPCLVPIFKEEGLGYSLNTKIEKYLPIEVSEEDELPVHLCYHCASTLIAWDSLIVGCIEAEKKLNLLRCSAGTQQFEDIQKSGEVQTDKGVSEEQIGQKKAAPDGKGKKQSKVKSNEKRDILQEKNEFNTPLETDTTGTERRRNCETDPERNQENLSNDLDYCNDEGEYEESGSRSKDDLFESEQDCSQDLNVIPKAWLNIITCKYCGKISCAPKHLRQHEKRGTCTKNFQCDDCGQLFTKEMNLTRHLKRHEKEKLVDKVKRFTCSVCHKKFKFEDNGLAHEKICGKTESTHKCIVCGKRFETKELADQHWTCHHKSCVCHMCGQTFGKPESLKQHVRTVHEELKMVCHYCGKKFSRKARLQEHLQHHTGQMDFTCHVCGKGSTNAYSFGVHLATHSQETPYSCSFCPRTFKHMKYVYLHERSVHLKLKSGKTYVKPKKPGKNVAQRTCPLCNKTFKRESAMLIHKRSVHEGKNGYICKLCGKDFKYTYLLYVHKKKHHFPELCKYVCQFCEKPFPVKTELQNHLRKHTGEKPYICGLCGKTYSFHGSLNMHMKTQHENKKNFKCTVCGSSYNFQSHLTRHMSAHVDKYPVEMLSNV